MQKKKRSQKMLLFLTLALALGLLAAGLTGCGSSSEPEEQAEPTEVTEVTATQEELDLDTGSLMDQVADQEITKSYEEYLPDEALANCELFGVRDGKAYVYLNVEEFVVLKGKAYEMSGGSGEAIISYEETGDGVKLKGVEWSADGGDHDKWLEENFPEPFLKADKDYQAHDENGYLKLNTKMIAKAEEVLGVPVERENLLQIDTEKGTYEIVKTSESGNPEDGDYEFNTETLEKGKLSDLK